MSVAEIIKDLGGTAVVAEGVGASLPMVCNWRSRERIPSDWWPQLVRLADERGVNGITLERLAEAQKPREPRSLEARA